MNEWTTQLNSGAQVDVIYTDFAKAFHTVAHRRLLSKLKSERLPFWSGSSHYSHFLTENERENASFFNASIFHPIFQSENGKLSRNIKPCLRYNVTGMWLYCISKQHGAPTFYCIIFYNEINGVFTAKKLSLKLVKR